MGSSCSQNGRRCCQNFNKNYFHGRFCWGLKISWLRNFKIKDNGWCNDKVTLKKEPKKDVSAEGNLFKIERYSRQKNQRMKTTGIVQQESYF